MNQLQLISTFSQLHGDLLQCEKSQSTFAELVQQAIDEYLNGDISLEDLAFKSFKAMYTNSEGLTITDVVSHYKEM